MAYLLRYDEESREMVPKALPGAPFSHYYAQENSDEGIIMETDVGVKEVSDLPTYLYWKLLSKTAITISIVGILKRKWNKNALHLLNFVFK